MKRQRSRLLIKLTAILLAVSLCAPIGAQAALPETADPMASDYWQDYDACICATGDGNLEIQFEILGITSFAEIGVLTIYLYESTDNSNFSCVETFHCSEYENMLRYNAYSCVDHVDYEGVPGRYYKAYMLLWATSGTGGGSKYIWSPVERCI